MGAGGVAAAGRRAGAVVGRWAGRVAAGRDVGRDAAAGRTAGVAVGAAAGAAAAGVGVGVGVWAAGGVAASAAAARAAICCAWNRAASFSVSSRAWAGCIWAMMAARVRGQTHLVLQRGHDRRGLLGTHGRIDLNQPVDLGLFAFIHLTQHLLHLGLQGGHGLNLGVQLLLGGDHQRQGGGEILIARVQGRATLGQGLDDLQLRRGNPRLLSQLFRRQGRAGSRQGGLGRRAGDGGCGFFGPGLGPVEQARGHAHGAHGDHPADGDGDQGQKAGDTGHLIGFRTQAANRSSSRLRRAALRLCLAEWLAERPAVSAWTMAATLSRPVGTAEAAARRVVAGPVRP